MTTPVPAKPDFADLHLKASHAPPFWCTRVDQGKNPEKPKLETHSGLFPKPFAFFYCGAGVNKEFKRLAWWLDIEGRQKIRDEHLQRTKGFGNSQRMESARKT